MGEEEEDSYRTIFVGDKKIDAYITAVLGSPNSVLKARGKYRSRAEDTALICEREYNRSIESIKLYNTELKLEDGETKYVSAIDIYMTIKDKDT